MLCMQYATIAFGLISTAVGLFIVIDVSPAIFYCSDVT